MKFGKLSRFSLEGQALSLDFEGAAARVEIITPRIFRVYACLSGTDIPSKAIEGCKALPACVTLQAVPGGVQLSTREASLRISDGFFTDLFDRDGALICADYRGPREPLPRVSPEYIRLLEAEGHAAQELTGCQSQPVEVLKAMPRNAHFYGLGDKTGFLDKRGYAYEMWNTDDPKPHVDTFKALYKSIPFLITLTDRHVFGLFADNTFHSYFNLGQESEKYFYFSSDGGNLDYYYIAGDSIPQVLEGYTHLTGRCPLPQKWTLGYHQSRWGYVTREDIASIARNLRSRDIPCDSIHMDIDYMDAYKVFTWNHERYGGDPKGFLTELSAQGFKPVTIIDPGVKQEEGYSIYDRGVKEGFFATTPEGEIYVNAVWPGDAVFPDFGRQAVRTWWGENHRFLTGLGVRGIWNDMNEPASFHGPLPEDVVFHDEDRAATHAELHNVYGHFMAKATYEGMKAADGRRPFVITRACYAGTQKYSTVWTGDNTSMWANLQMAIPQLCNLGLSGMPFAGTDIGGFGGDTTPELLTRWVQVGCFCPLFRNHSAMGTRYQEPWQFGPEVEAIYRKYVKLRYRLIPYFYDLFRESSRTGAPTLRPLVYHYQNDPVAQVCNDEFLVGSNLLVAPVVTQGSTLRAVYLPEGTWYDYWTREVLPGGGWLLRDAPLDTCPLYVKAGAILPMMEEQSYVGQKEGVLLLDLFPGQGQWEHYQDNGEDFAYQKGEYNLYRFTLEPSGAFTSQQIYSGYACPYREIRVVTPGL